MTQNGLTMPFVRDVNSAAAFQVQAIPKTVFFDAQGNKVDEMVGGMSLAQFESKLQQIL